MPTYKIFFSKNLKTLRLELLTLTPMEKKSLNKRLKGHPAGKFEIETAGRKAKM